MNKSCLLYSGGFDSTVLLYDLAHKLSGEIICIHFDFGQPTFAKEAELAQFHIQTLVDKGFDVKYKSFKISMPFAIEDYDGYVEARNLIFVSYGISYCQKNKIDNLFMGFIKVPENFEMSDANDLFVDYVHDLAVGFGVIFDAPFLYTEKVDLTYYIKLYDINVDTLFSCNVSNVPCGKCNSCESRDSILKFIKPSLLEIWSKDNYKFNCDFIEEFLRNKISKVVLNLNNKCLYNCLNCYHEEEPSSQLLVEGIFEFIDSMCAYNEDVEFIISGKEDTERLEPVLKHINRKGNKATVVANSNTLKNFADKSIFKNVIIPYSGNFGGELNRDYFDMSVVKELLEKGVNVKVRIYLVNAPHKEYTHTINFLIANGISNIELMPVYYYGKARKVMFINPLEYLYLLNSLYSFTAQFEVYIRDSYLEFINNYTDPQLRVRDDIKFIMQTGIRIIDNVTYNLEPFCMSYYDTIVMTCDGLLLGCEKEACSFEYSYKSFGNIYDNLNNTILEGKRNTLRYLSKGEKCKTLNGCTLCIGGCKEEKYCYNPLVINRRCK